MKRLLERVAALGHALLTRPAGAYVMAVVYAAVHIQHAVSGLYASERGLDVWFSALAVTNHPWATLFFVESHPPLAVLFAPVAPFGRTAFAIANVLLSTATIPLLSRVASKLGHTRPNLTALLLALSPTFYAACSSAPPESAATAGLVLALYLVVVRDRVRAAGAVGGVVALALPLTLPLVLALGLITAAPRRRRFRAFTLAAATPIGIYGAAFASYHLGTGGSIATAFGVLGSFVDLPTTAGEAVSTMTGVEGLFGAIVALGPTLAFAPFARRASLSTMERGAAVTAAGYAAFVWHLPLLMHTVAPPLSLVPVLPFIALLAGRGIDVLIDGEQRRGWATVYAVGMLGLAEIAELWRASSNLLALTIFVALVVVASNAARPRVAIWLTVAVLAAGPSMFIHRTGLLAIEQVDGLRDAVVFFLDHRDLSERTIVTNVPLFDRALSAHAPDDRRTVYLVRTRARRAEIDARTSPEQRAALEVMWRDHPTGHPIDEDDLEPLLQTPGVLIVSVNDAWQRALLRRASPAHLRALRLGDVRVDETAASD